MVTKYVIALEERQIYEKTGEIWTINDVPSLWRTKTKKQVIADGYVFNEDGTVSPSVEE